MKSSTSHLDLIYDNPSLGLFKFDYRVNLSEIKGILLRRVDNEKGRESACIYFLTWLKIEMEDGRLKQHG
jgi:hypothetical protein